MEQPAQQSAPRVLLHLPVEYRRNYARQHDSGTLRNISLSGAFLQTGEGGLLQGQDKICLTFNVGGRSRKIQASIVWKNDSGAGIQFHHFNNRDMQIIDDLMYFVESSRQAKRELLDSIFSKVIDSED